MTLNFEIYKMCLKLLKIINKNSRERNNYSKNSIIFYSKKLKIS